jgi:hypothetical protein
MEVPLLRKGDVVKVVNNIDGREFLKIGSTHTLVRADRNGERGYIKYRNRVFECHFSRFKWLRRKIKNKIK